MLKTDNRLSIMQALNPNESVWRDGITSDLKCPECGYENQHLLQPQFVSGNDNYEANWNGRGDLVLIPVESECGSKWELCFGFHKGYTSAFIRLQRSCKPMGYVYFIESIGLDKIKIGFSENPEKRLQQLKTGSADNLYLKAKILGKASLELELHKRFDHLRKDGEWFHATKELREFIKQFITERSKNCYVRKR